MLWPAPGNREMLTALAGGCIFLNFLYFLQKKTLNSPTAGVYWEFFSAFYNYLRLCVAFWQSAFWKSCVSPVGPLPFPAGFPGCAWFCLPFCILYINYYSLFLLCYFCSGEDFSQYVLLFSYTFTYYRRFLESFLFRIKLAIQKGELFFFFFCCQKISLNKPFSPLPSLFCHCALPCSAGKAANWFFHCAAFFSHQHRRKLSFRCLLCPQPLAYWEFFSAELRVLFWQNQQKRTLSTAEYFSFFVGRKLFFHRNFSLNSAEENSQSTYYI